MNGSLFLKGLQMSLTASYVFCVVFLVRLFLRKIGRKYCYYLWFIVFLNLCIPFSIYSSFSLVPGVLREQTARIENEPLEKEEQETELPEQWVLLQNTQMREYDQSIFEDILTYGDSDREAINNAADPKDLKDSQASWKSYLPLAEKIWLLGILFFGVYSCAASFRFQYRLRKSKKCFLDRREGIIEVKRLSSPFVWGIFSPKIYLPADMEAEERNYVLFHEEYHRKRKDHLVKLLLYGITIIYWYHPLVWISYHLCCKDMEISCDEAVLERADTNLRKAYAKSLLKFAAKQNHYVLTPLTFGEPAVRSRIKNVLKYRKKGLGLSILAAVLCIFLGIGLMTQPKKTVLEEDVQTAPADFLKLKVSNNGGEVLKAGSRIYYENGRKLYSDGRYLYGTAEYEEGSPSAIYRYELDGSGYKRLTEGRILGVSGNLGKLYYLSDEKAENAQEGVFAGTIDLRTEETKIFSILHDFTMEEVTCADMDEQGIFFAAGAYEGSAGYYYGNFYYADFVTGELNEKHLTDADEFWIMDGRVYYQKYDNFGESGSDIYSTDLSMSEELLIAENTQLLAVDREAQKLLTEKDGKLCINSTDGNVEKELPDPRAAFDGEIMENDHMTFTEVNVIGDTVYMKAQLWRYEEENGWRDSLIGETYFKLSLQEEEYQTWDPKGLQELAEEVDRLNEPIPGKPLEDVSAWDLEKTIDLRESFQQMSYASEAWIEDQVYLLGKTEHYTLYGKGNQEELLLECEGAYAKLQYPYTSNYMTPLELLEVELDGDGQKELGIKFNIKHGTGVSIDTLFIADLETEGTLFVYQFLEEYCCGQLQEHISYEATEKGVQAKIDGKDAGAFLENEEGMDPYIKVICGAQLHFTYENGQIIAGADLQFLQDETGAFYGSNGQEICGVVNWNPEDGFILTGIFGRSV